MPLCATLSMVAPMPSAVSYIPMPIARLACCICHCPTLSEASLDQPGASPSTVAVTRLQGSSSDAAGIQQGDELLSIDGVPLTSQSPFQAASLLQVRASTSFAASPACPPLAVA